MLSSFNYLPIRLSDRIRPATVGTFIPSHLVPSFANVIDVVVYLHGNIIEACGTVPDAFLKRGIEYYWSTPFFKCLHEELEASNKNAILIAPTLSTSFGSSSPSWAPRYGDLDKDKALDNLIYNTFTMLADRNAIPRTASVGRIILAGHSAGGMPMKRILEATNSLRHHIVECWGFECLYFGTDTWVEWLDERDHIFMHYRQASQMGSATALLNQHPGFEDYHGGRAHCTLVRDFWRQALERSHVLMTVQPAPVVVARVEEAAQPRWWDLRELWRS